MRKVQLDGTIVTIAGDGRLASDGDGGPATSAALTFPYGVAFDRDGNLYIADLGAARLRKVSAGGTMSPRGDWRMPSDVAATAWLAELEDVPTS